MRLKDTVLVAGRVRGGDAVDMHGAIRRLGGDVLIERVPRNSLYIVTVFGDLVYAFA